VLAARRQQLEMPEAGEGRCYPADDGAGLGDRMAIVEHVANDAFTAADQTQCARRRHAQVVHGLAAQELADRRAQDRAPVGPAGIGRWPGTLELQFETLAAPIDRFTEQDRPAVAELPGPLPELVTAVAAGVADHAGQQAVARQRVEQRRRGHVLRVEIELCRDFARVGEQRRCGDRSRGDR
jgi:hypothetical protein